MSWSTRPWYPNITDAQVFKTRAGFIHLVSNGSNCVVPALQSCHAEVKKSQDTLIDNLKDGD